MSDPQRLTARIADVRPLGGGVREIRLQADARPVDFLPGQYLLIQHPDGSAIPFSIASAPAEWPRLTLHYLAQPDSEDALRMDDILAVEQTLELELPHGDCGIATPLEQPLLMLAGGSGIAQVRSILRSLLPQSSRPLRVYWGTASARDLYLQAELNALARAHLMFSWEGVTESGDPGTRQGLVADAVISDVARGTLSLPDWQVLIAGGPAMVWGTVEALVPHGLQRSRTRADAFSYAPRTDVWPD